MRRGWPPFRRRWVRAALRPAHRSRGSTETQTASACFCVCVSVPPLDRCRAQRAPPACCPWHFSPRDSAPPRPLREVLSARSAARCRDGKIIQVRLLRPGRDTLRTAIVQDTVHGLMTFCRAHASEVATLIAQHMALVAASTLAAVAAGVPLGVLAARRPRVGGPLSAAASVVQTIPSLALFGFLLPLPLVGGVGARTALTALILYALLPVIRTTAAGLRAIDPAILEAAAAMGMSPRQSLLRVGLPPALPAIVAGIRVATVVGVGTVTIAAAIGAGGLGEYIYRGLSMVDATVILAGAIPARVMGLVADSGWLLIEPA